MRKFVILSFCLLLCGNALHATSFDPEANLENSYKGHPYFSGINPLDRELDILFKENKASIIKSCKIIEQTWPGEDHAEDTIKFHKENIFEKCLPADNIISKIKTNNKKVEVIQDLENYVKHWRMEFYLRLMNKKPGQPFN